MDSSWREELYPITWRWKNNNDRDDSCTFEKTHEPCGKYLRKHSDIKKNIFLPYSGLALLQRGSHPYSSGSSMPDSPKTRLKYTFV